MPLIVVIEPDQRQATIVRRLVRDYVSAEVVWADTKDRALSALSTRVPDLILVSALLPPRDELELTEHLRGLRGAAHLQTLTIPQLASPEGRSRRKTLLGSIGKRRGQSAGTGCDPRVFAEEIRTYLGRAGELRAETEAIAAARGQMAAARVTRTVDVQAAVSLREEPAVTEQPAVPVDAPAITDAVVAKAATDEGATFDLLPGEAIQEAIAESLHDELTATVQATIAEVPDEQPAETVAWASPAEPAAVAEEITEALHEQIAPLIAAAADEAPDEQPVPTIEEATSEEAPVGAAAPATADHGTEIDGGAERAVQSVTADEAPPVSNHLVVAADDAQPASDNLPVTVDHTPPAPDSVAIYADDAQPASDDLTVAAEETLPVSDSAAVAADDALLATDDLTVAAEDTPPVSDSVAVYAEDALLAADDLTVVAEDTPPVSDSVTVYADDALLATDDLTVAAEETPPVSDNVAVYAEDALLAADDLTVVAEDTPPVSDALVVLADDAQPAMDGLTVAETAAASDIPAVAADNWQLTSDSLPVADALPVSDDPMVVADDSQMAFDDLPVASQGAAPASTGLMCIAAAPSSVEEETQPVAASIVDLALTAPIHVTWPEESIEAAPAPEPAAVAAEAAPPGQVTGTQTSRVLSVEELLALERELEPDAPFESALQMVPQQRSVEDAVLSLGEEDPAIEIVEAGQPSEAPPALAAGAAEDDWLSKTVWSLTEGMRPSQTRTDSVRDPGTRKAPRSAGLADVGAFDDESALPATRRVAPHRGKAHGAARSGRPLSTARLTPLALWARVESERPESEAVRAADRNVFLSLINRLRIPPEVARVSYASGARIARVRVAPSCGEPEGAPPVIILSKSSLKRPKRSPRKTPLPGTGRAGGAANTPTSLI